MYQEDAEAREHQRQLVAAELEGSCFPKGDGSAYQWIENKEARMEYAQWLSGDLLTGLEWDGHELVVRRRAHPSDMWSAPETVAVGEPFDFARGYASALDLGRSDSSP